MTLSIIMPTKDCGDTLGVALDSIVRQSFTDWEVLLMDGGSSDDTLSIAEAYHDSRIHIYSEPDRGIYDAMNKGILKAGGEWLYFLGSDDYLFDDQVLNFFFQNNDFSQYQVVYGEVEAAGFDKNKGEWSLDLLDYNRCHQAIFYKKSFFFKYGLYNLKYTVLSDYDCNLKWFLNRNVRKRYVSRTVAHYSRGGFSSEHSDERMDRDVCWLIYRRGRDVFSYSQCRFWLKQFRLKNRQDVVRYILSSFYISVYSVLIHTEWLFRSGE